MEFDLFNYVKKIFPLLHVQDIAKLVSKTKIISLKEKELLIKKGEKNPKAALIIKGLVRAYHLVEEDQKTVLFRKEGEFIGSPHWMFSRKPAVEEVEALENSWLVEVDFQTFKKLAEKNLPLARAYNTALESMLMDAIIRIESFTALSPEERYLKFIENNKGLAQRIPMKHLASYLGVTPFSLSRIRRRIADRPKLP